MTRTSLSRSKGQGHQAALHTAALTRYASAAVSVGTYWLWEPTATLRSALCRCGQLDGVRRFRDHRPRRGPGAYCGGRPPTAFYVFGFIFSVTPTKNVHNFILTFLMILIQHVLKLCPKITVPSSTTVTLVF